MKKLFTSTLLLILLAVISAIGVSAAAVKKLNENMSLKSLLEFPDKNTYIFKINDLVKENLDLTKTIEDLEEQTKYYNQILGSLGEGHPMQNEYKLKVLPLEKDLALAEFEEEYYDDKNDIDKKILQYNLQAKYYDLCLLDGKIDSANYRAEYLNTALEIEQAKLLQERTTENNVALSEIEVRFANNEIANLKTEKNQTEHMIANMLSQYDADNYSFVLEIPDIIPTFSKTEEALIIHFFNKNYDMRRVKKQIEVDEKYFKELEKIYGKENDEVKKLKNSIEKSKLEYEILEEDYKLHISGKFNDYQTVLANKNACNEYRKVLADKLLIIQASLDNGQISLIEYMNQNSDVKSALIDCDNADVALIMIVKELELLDEGIEINL